MAHARWLVVVAALVATAFVNDADARRLGGGGGKGMQRSLPRSAAPTTPPPTTAPQAQPPATTGAPATAAATRAAPPTATAPAPAPRRSWLGPIAGLAAGLGLAALMSHLGFGAEFGSLLLIVIAGLAALMLVRAFMRRSAPTYAGGPAASPAYAGAPTYDGAAARGTWDAGAAPLAGAASATPSATLPDGFDAAAFAHLAKQLFVRLQAANDAGRLDELRAFTTPQLYGSLRDEIAARGGRPQRTDVVRLDAAIEDHAVEDGRQVVSVRFHGLVREADEGTAEPFDEVWHFVRAADGRGEWAIAGIQQLA